MHDRARSGTLLPLGSHLRSREREWASFGSANGFWESAAEGATGMTEFASGEWKRAMGALVSAEALLEIDANSAVSRAYYAAFHAVSALFAL